jgi:WD40 repeat protein/DNA-binding SARP family transcriptional activator
MEFRLLGPFEVTDGGTTLPLGGPKQRVVLVHLVLRANEVVDVDRLIDLVWGSVPPPSARSTLQGYVSHLRQALGADRLQHRGQGYLLRTGEDEVDATRVERLLADARACRATDVAGALARLDEALAAWRGAPLSDLATQPSMDGEIARLEELRLTAVEDRLGLILELGRHHEVVPELRALVVEHPLRERLCAQLLVALYRSGRQTEAVEAYERTRTTLREGYGLDPSSELQRLHERILRQDETLTVSGRPLRGYRLYGVIGAGAFSTVYRGSQDPGERPVAIKIVRPELANDPGFVRRFDAEAQALAALEHPHIVPLEDHWRDPEGAFLVMRLLSGGDLRARLARGPLEPAGVARVVDQLAGALGAAARRGIVHGDLRPENVLFDADDNGYVSDFGIASDLVDGRAGAAPDRDRYLAPEVRSGGAATPRSDAYSLGVLAKDMLGELAAAAPVAAVLARATAACPTERRADAAGLASDLHTALALTPVARGLAARNPYKGLRPFSQADAGDFFGREELVARLVRRLGPDAWRLLAVVGPSGSGKSSLVRAGLLPALRGGAAPGSEGWYVAELVPGADPVGELRAALLRLAVRPMPEELAAHLDAPDGLRRAADWVLPDDGAELLVVIDQFEQLFTLVDDVEQRVRFARMLADAIAAEDGRVRLVLVLRADLYDRPLRYPELAALLGTHTEVVPPLTEEELERAIVCPAAAVGVPVHPALVARMVADVADSTGALPLLQYALTELFEERRGGALSLAGYREIGGVAGALTRGAEAVVAPLHAEELETTRQVFLHLVVPIEGGGVACRRVPRSDLVSPAAPSAAVEDVLGAFAAAGLVTFDRDPDSRRPTVEVAHESLVDGWPRCRGWIAAARADLALDLRLRDLAEQWHDAARDPSFLVSGAHLEQLERWERSAVVAPTTLERAYLRASVAERDRREQLDAEARDRARALERRSMRRLRGLVAVFAVLGLVATSLTVLAVDRGTQVRTTGAEAAAEALTARAVASLERDPEQSALLALEAADLTRAADGSVLPATEEVLRQAMFASRLVRSVPGGGALAVSVDGTRFATTDPQPDGGDGTVTVWATGTGSRVAKVGGHTGPITAVAFSPDGTGMATGGADGVVQVRSLAATEPGAAMLLTGHTGPVTQVVFDPGGRWLASASTDGTVRLWGTTDGAEVRVLRGHRGPVLGLSVHLDGATLASTGEDGTLRVYDTSSGTVVVARGHEGPVGGVAFAPDGSTIATASTDATLRTWNPATGEQRSSVATPAGIHAVAYSPDGETIATGGAEAVVAVHDLRTGRVDRTIGGHTAPISALAFAADGDRLLTTAADGTARMWDLTVAGGRDWLTVAASAHGWSGVAISPDGTRLAIAAEQGVSVRDLTTGDEVAALEGRPGPIAELVFSPDGRLVAGASAMGSVPAGRSTAIAVWDVRTGELTMLAGHDGAVGALAFSPDAALLLSGGADGTVRVWDLATGAERGSEQVGAGPFDGVGGVPVVAVAYVAERPVALTTHPDGALVVWDAISGERREVMDGPSAPARDAAFGPDSVLAVAHGDGTVSVWDTAAETARWTARHGATINQVAVDHRGTVIATSGSDGVTRLWDAADGTPLLALHGHTAETVDVAFSRDGRLLASSSPDGTVTVHLLPVDEFLAHARARLERAFGGSTCLAGSDAPCPLPVHTGTDDGS